MQQTDLKFDSNANVYRPVGSGGAEGAGAPLEKISGALHPLEDEAVFANEDFEDTQKEGW